MNPKFFTVEEANRLIGFLEATIERIARNKQRFLWLQEEISILKLIVECGADSDNSDATELEEKLRVFKAVGKEIEKDKAAINETGCIVRDEERGLVDFFSIQNNTVVYLCWKKGEEEVRYWHSIHDDFEARQPLAPSKSA